MDSLTVSATFPYKAESDPDKNFQTSNVISLIVLYCAYVPVASFFSLINDFL